MFNGAQVNTFSWRKPQGWGTPLSLCFLRPMLAALCLASLLFSVKSLKQPFHFFRNFTDSLTFTFLFSFFTLDVLSRSMHKKLFPFVFKFLKYSSSFFLVLVFPLKQATCAASQFISPRTFRRVFSPPQAEKISDNLGFYTKFNDTVSFALPPQYFLPDGFFFNTLPP